MGDRAREKWTEKLGEGLLCLCSSGELGPHLTQCHLRRGLLRSKWHPDLSSRLATTDMGRGLYGRMPMGDIVLDGDPAPHGKGTAAHTTFRPMSIVAKRLDDSRYHLVRR